MAAAVQDDAALSADRIPEMIRLGFLVAKFPNGNRDTSQAYNVMERIYRVLDGNREKLADIPWYRCSWCDILMNVLVRQGTTPLIRHIRTWKSRPDDYILPAQNLHIRNRAIEAGPQMNAANEIQSNTVNSGNGTNQNLSQQMNQNKAHAHQVSASSSNKTSVDNEQVLNLSKSNQIEPPQITDDQMADILARLSEIIVLHGNISAAEFKKLLPLQSNQEYLSNFYKEVKRIASANSGINSPRCNIGPRKRHAPNSNADDPADEGILPATGDENEQIGSERPFAAKQATKKKQQPFKETKYTPEKDPSCSTKSWN